MGSTLQKAKLEIETRKLKRREGTLKQSKVPTLTNQRWGTPRNNRDAGLSPHEERGESLETGAKPGATKPNALLPFHRDGGGLGELERQLALGSEEGYVLVRLGLSRILGIGFGLALRSRDRIGVQRVGFPVDFHRSERHLQFALSDLDDAAGYLGAPGNHGLSIYLNRGSEAGGKGVTNLVLVSGQRLSCRRTDRRAFRQGDHCRRLCCFGYDGRFCCHGRFGRRSRFCRFGFLCSVTGFVRGRLRAARCRQDGCRCQSKPEIPMHLRVEHFTPPKGHPWGEWDEVAGWPLHRSKLTDRLRTMGIPYLP